MSSHITLVFEHTPCVDVRVDVRLPLPDPVEEGAEAIADRIRPTCPACKEAMQYVGFYFGNEDDAPEPNRPFPGPGDL